MRNLKQRLDHRLIFKYVHKIIKFNQTVWLKPYIHMNTDLRKKKLWFWKRFFLVDEEFSFWKNYGKYELDKNLISLILNLSKQKEEGII